MSRYVRWALMAIILLGVWMDNKIALYATVTLSAIAHEFQSYHNEIQASITKTTNEILEKFCDILGGRKPK